MFTTTNKRSNHCRVLLFAVCFIQFSRFFKVFQFQFGVSGRSCGLVPLDLREILCYCFVVFAELTLSIFKLCFD